VFRTPTVAPGAPLESAAWHSAYIAPDGTFHYVPTHSHYLVGRTLHHADGSAQCPYFSDCDDALQARGWVHLTEGTIVTLRPLTYNQRDTLYDVGAAIADGDEYGDMVKGFRSTFARLTGEDY